MKTFSPSQASNIPNMTKESRIKSKNRDMSFGIFKFNTFSHFQFGESQKLRLVRILRSTVMVRVGGGWVALDEFLLKNDPCRGKCRPLVYFISCILLKISKIPATWMYKRWKTLIMTQYIIMLTVATSKWAYTTHLMYLTI